MDTGFRYMYVCLYIIILNFLYCALWHAISLWTECEIDLCLVNVC